MTSYSRNHFARLIPIVIIATFVIWISAPILAQSTIATGNIQGTLTDAIHRTASRSVKETKLIAHAFQNRPQHARRQGKP
jgi:hypothetical protein